MSTRHQVRRDRAASPSARQHPNQRSASAKSRAGADSDKAPHSGTSQKKKRSWPVRLLIWGVPIAAAAVLTDYTVPEVHAAVIAGTCAVKYAAASPVNRPSATAWSAFGTSQVTLGASSLAVGPNPAMGAADEWFGASLPVTSSCDYEISFQASLTGPLYSAPGAGYGYGVGVRGDVDNGVPTATTIQYDPPFRGLRTVDVPANANANGYSATLYPDMTSSRSRHWDILVRGNTMEASLDGQAYVPVRLDADGGNRLIIRVWNATVVITDVSVARVPPRL